MSVEDALERNKYMATHGNTLTKVSVILKSRESLACRDMLELEQSCLNIWHHSKVQDEDIYASALSRRSVSNW